MNLVKSLFSTWFKNDEIISDEELPSTDPFLIKHDDPVRRKAIYESRMQKFISNSTESENYDDNNKSSITLKEVGVQFPDEPLPRNPLFDIPPENQIKKSSHRHLHHHSSNKSNDQVQNKSNFSISNKSIEKTKTANSNKEEQSKSKTKFVSFSKNNDNEDNKESTETAKPSKFGNFGLKRRKVAKKLH